MKIRRTIAAMLAAAAAATPAHAQEVPYKTSFIRLAPGVPGVLYEPQKPGPRARIAVFAMHSSADYTAHSSCTELSKRGYRVLCANNSTSKAGVSDDGLFDRVLGEAGAAVTWLRSVPGVEKVVLFGHSGGSALMTAYQMIAEGGVATCQGPEKINKCSDTLAGLPKADGIVLADANWGQPTLVLFSIDPAIVDEASGMKLNSDLDMFDTANGFVASGSSYSPAFIEKFQRAAAARNAVIVKRARDRLALIEAGKGLYADDEPFDVPGASFLGSNNKLYSQDVRLLSRSLRPWPLVHKDGSVTVDTIRSVRPALNTESHSRSYLRGAIKTTVRNFLNTYATRTTTDFGYGETSEVRGVDWRSNYANSPGNVERISAPLLTLGMTGGWEGLAAETIHDRAASKDKSIAFIEGATHVYTTCTRCEKTPGEFGDTVKTTYDYIDGWLSKPGRF